MIKFENEIILAELKAIGITGAKASAALGIIYNRRSLSFNEGYVKGVESGYEQGRKFTEEFDVNCKKVSKYAVDLPLESVKIKMQDLEKMHGKVAILDMIAYIEYAEKNNIPSSVVMLSVTHDLIKAKDEDMTPRTHGYSKTTKNTIDKTVQNMNGLNQGSSIKKDVESEIKEKIERVLSMFKTSFVYNKDELILHKKWNVYFRLPDIKSAAEFDYKILSYLSFYTASNHYRKTSAQYVWASERISAWFGKEFSHEELQGIYQKYGNGANREEGVEFIKSGLDISLLNKK